ncbi:MAG TPA: YebC/PmpR family DNA-binding transcriptional regulator, partial [Candidatus Enterococcus avicola]|nr:YebC/PmpR family DNA-binding transcriptional regulator [Candidatus Enterococcus avicola]
VAFNKNGGSLGETGSVNYMFDRKGYLAIEREGLAVSEDDLFEKVLEAGGEDLITSPEVFEIYTAAEDFVTVRDTLEQEFTLAQAELTMIPQTTIQLDTEKQAQLEALIEKLEDDDDVTEVYTSVEE